jgi:hypothetical protein
VSTNVAAGGCPFMPLIVVISMRRRMSPASVPIGV